MFIWPKSLTPHPKVAFSSAGGPPIPFSADIIDGVLVMKRLQLKGDLLLSKRATVRDVLARKWVARHDSMRRKDFHITREIFRQARLTGSRSRTLHQTRHVKCTEFYDKQKHVYCQ